MWAGCTGLGGRSLRSLVSLASFARRRLSRLEKQPCRPFYRPEFVGSGCCAFFSFKVLGGHLTAFSRLLEGGYTGFFRCFSGVLVFMLDYCSKTLKFVRYCGSY